MRQKDIVAFFEIRRIASEIKPDIIHLHSSKAGALGRFAFNGKRVPLFYTPHGYSFLMRIPVRQSGRYIKALKSFAENENAQRLVAAKENILSH